MNQIDKLIEISWSIASTDAARADELAFMARVLVQATLPHSDPGDVKAFGRENGNFKLKIQPGIDTGVPYGSYPRLVLAWITTEAVRTKSRRITLGDSLSHFMSELDITPTGGRWGTITRLRDQMKRLFAARIAAVYDGDDAYLLNSVEIATDADLWWDPKRPDQAAVFESTVTLGEKFFEEIVRRPVPLDMRALRALKKSPLGLDLYTWLTYRVSYLRDPVEVSWQALHAQFGADYASHYEFARKAKRELKKISLVWPELSYDTPRGRLALSPSPTHVKKLKAGS
jgi:hypothetical protein